MKLTHLALACAFSAAVLGAQTASDVGLTMGGGMLTVIYGQDCGPFTCQPFQAGPVGSGQPYDVSVYGKAFQPYVLAIDLPSTSPCLPFPGIANKLILQVAPVTLAIGVINSPVLIGSCNQARAHNTLLLPPATPPGIPLVLQGLAISASLNQPAFTVAIRTTTV